jgi:hypothetical protein
MTAVGIAVSMLVMAAALVGVAALIPATISIPSIAWILLLITLLQPPRLRWSRRTGPPRHGTPSHGAPATTRPPTARR